MASISFDATGLFFTIVMVLLFGGILFLFASISAGKKKSYERVRLTGQRHVAVIKDFTPMRGDREHVSLLLKIETPSGPVGRRLIIPLQGAVTWDFITTARVTERPVYVKCLLDPGIEEAVRQYGFLLEEAPS